jgi:hypothetical protein
VPEETPITVHATAGNKSVDTDPVMGVPPLPKGKTSLIGGKVKKLDGVRNKLRVKIFGGGDWDMLFDERTHFFRDGVATTFENVKKGDRVYVDTMLDPLTHHILARNVRVVTKTAPADARGQVESVDYDTIRIYDRLSAQAVRFSVTDSTQVEHNGRAASMNEVQPGSLIAVKFSPDKDNRAVARTITLIVSPGESFTFIGKVMHLDLSTGLVAVQNRTDSQTYDIFVNHDGTVPSNLMLGSQVKIAAVFDGRGYKANHITVESAQ